MSGAAATLERVPAPHLGSVTTTWPVDAWYVAATSDEVSTAPLGRKSCGQRMVFYRREDGTVAGLEDFCPHRGAPLSLGFVRGDRLVSAITGNR